MTHPQFIKLLQKHRESMPSQNKGGYRANLKSRTHLSIQGQAEILGVSYATLYGWTKKAPSEIVMLGVLAKIGGKRK